MEDDNGLDLTLGLTCSGSSSISKGKKSSSSDARTDEGDGANNLDRANKMINDFKYFLDGGNLKHDSAVKPEENFFNNFSSGAVNVDAFTNPNTEGFWLASDNRSSEVVQESRSNAGSKRKSYFDEINNHRKKHEGDAHNANLHEKTHISITTDEGSTADNEDVVDSGAKGSNSRLVPHRGSSEVLKEVHGVSNPSGVDFSPEKEFKFANAPHGVMFLPNIMNVPYQLPWGLNLVGAPGLSSYSLPGMQVRSSAISERPVNQPVMATNLPAMFGYSPVQVPMLDKDKSRGLLSHSQQLNPSYIGRGSQHSETTNDGLKISQGPQYDGWTLEQANGNGSSQREDRLKRSSTIARATDGPNQPSPVIRPGIAADVKFGGCGSFPNLPWVSTTGPGPNGRTISGVTYRYSATQLRIVCACHGSHLSPKEFIRHASEEQASPGTGSGLPAIPTSNPTTSAQS